jgi:Xaa-Pro aminopeptidase
MSPDQEPLTMPHPPPRPGAPPPGADFAAPSAGDLLEDLGAEALVVVADSSRDPDLAVFVGGAHLGRAVLLVPRQGAPRLACFSPLERGEAAATGLEVLDPQTLDLPRLTRDLTAPELRLAAVLERIFELCRLAPGRLALAGRARAGEVHTACRLLEQRGWHFAAGHEVVLRLRKRKGPEEVAEIRRAAAGAGAALRRVAQLLAAAVPGERGLVVGGEPLTVGRLKGEVTRVLGGAGLEQPEGCLVAPAEEGAVPHTTGTPERVVRAGESLVVDLFPRGRLFADCTRTFCVGEPPEALAAAHRAVREALAEAHRRVRPGVRGWELQEAVCGLFARGGWPTPVTHPGTLVGYVHSLGHGVGWELHEYPRFAKDAGAEGVLAQGDVMTLEPGLYDPEAGWGVRLEDLVHLDSGGPRNLTPLPEALDPREWLALLESP